MEGTGVEWSGGEWRGGKGRAGQGRVTDCLGGLSRVGISSRSTRPWNGQPPSILYTNVLLLPHLFPLLWGVDVSYETPPFSPVLRVLP